jgi:hypothetical protein
VPGLRDYLETAFMGEVSLITPSPTSIPDPTGTVAPTPSSIPQPTSAPDPTPSPIPSAVVTPTPIPADLTVTGLTVSPTPIKSLAAIGFDLSGSATVSIVIVDSRGVVIRSLLNQSPVAAGHIAANWDRRDTAGRRVKPGSYVVRVVANSATDAAQEQKPITVN